MNDDRRIFVGNLSVNCPLSNSVCCHAHRILLDSRPTHTSLSCSSDTRIASHTLLDSSISFTRGTCPLSRLKQIQDQPTPLCHAQCSSPTHNVSLTYSWPNNYIHFIQKTRFNQFDKELPRAKLASAVRFAWFKFIYTNFSFLRFGHPSTWLATIWLEDLEFPRYILCGFSSVTV